MFGQSNNSWGQSNPQFGGQQQFQQPQQGYYPNNGFQQQPNNMFQQPQYQSQQYQQPSNGIGGFTTSWTGGQTQFNGPATPQTDGRDYLTYYSFLKAYLEESLKNGIYPAPLVEDMLNTFHPNSTNPDAPAYRNGFYNTIGKYLCQFFPGQAEVSPENVYNTIAQWAERSMRRHIPEFEWYIDNTGKWTQPVWRRQQQFNNAPQFGQFSTNNVNPAAMGFTGKPTGVVGGVNMSTPNDGPADIFSGPLIAPDTVHEANSGMAQQRDMETKRWEREAQERSDAAKLNRRIDEAPKGPLSVMGNMKRPPMARVSDTISNNGYNGPAPVSSISSNEAFDTQYYGTQQPIPDNQRYVERPQAQAQATPEKAPMSPAPTAPFGVNPNLKKDPSNKGFVNEAAETFEYTSLKSNSKYHETEGRARFGGFDLDDIIEAKGSEGSDFKVIDMTLKFPASSPEKVVNYVKPILSESKSFLTRINYKRMRTINLGASTYNEVRSVLRNNINEIDEKPNPAAYIDRILSDVLNVSEYKELSRLVVDSFNECLQRHCFDIDVPDDVLGITTLVDIDKVIRTRKFAARMGDGYEFWAYGMRLMFKYVLGNLFVNSPYIFDEDAPNINDLLSSDKDIVFFGMNLKQALVSDNKSMKNKYFREFFKNYTVVYTSETTYFTDLLDEEKVLPAVISQVGDNSYAGNALINALSAEVEGNKNGLVLGESLMQGYLPLYARDEKALNVYATCFPIIPLPSKILIRNSSGDSKYDQDHTQYDHKAMYPAKRDEEESEDEIRVETVAPTFEPEEEVIPDLKGLKVEYISPEEEAKRFPNSTAGNRHPLDSRIFDDIDFNDVNFGKNGLDELEDLDGGVDYPDGSDAQKEIKTNSKEDKFSQFK